MASKERTYHEQTNIDYTLRLRELLKTLPPFAKDYFRAIEYTSSIRTRLNYAYDIRVFYHYLIEYNPVYRNYSIEQFQPADLEKLSAVDIEEYMDYLKVYKSDDDALRTNGEKGLARKMSALRSFYGYYYKHQVITQNPTLLVDMPKQHEKAIIRLDVDEVALLLDYVESAGSTLSGQALKYYEKTRDRDLAILTLLLGTGIRVSECVGLNLSDVDLKEQGIHIHRKGGKEATVYFSNEVAQYLERYLEERMELHTKANHTEELNPQEEPALFLSLRRKRLTVRSVEYLVKKYASVATPKKKITPHKLRSSYGSALYAKTNDIYLVADILGHNDVNITRKFYAAIEEERRKSVKHIDLL